MKQMKLNRKEFIVGTLGAGVLGCRSSQMTLGQDENLSVLIPDLHVGGANPLYAYTRERLDRVVEAILAMRPLPKRVVCFGDIALTYGLAADYATSKPILQRIIDAGIELHLTMGNHDRRSNFFRFWPDYAAHAVVPGRCTRVVSLGTADLVLLDTLKGTDDRAEDDMGPVEGTIDPAQLAWFEGFVAQAKRPFFVGSHQFRDLYVENRKPLSIAAANRNFVGWIFGHDHEWCTQLQPVSWKDKLIYQTQALPSTGLWGDIGYVTMRTTESSAELELFQDDFYFTTPRPISERPASWDSRVRDNEGRRMRFVFDSICK